MQDLRPQDYRGASEIRTWLFLLGTTAIMNLGYMYFSTRNGGEMKVEPIMMGSFIGLVAAASNRGTQGANERSGSSNAINAAAAELKEAAAIIKAPVVVAAVQATDAVQAAPVVVVAPPIVTPSPAAPSQATGPLPILNPESMPISTNDPREGNK